MPDIDPDARSIFERGERVSQPPTIEVNILIPASKGITVFHTDVTVWRRCDDKIDRRWGELGQSLKAIVFYQSHSRKVAQDHW